MGVDLRIDLNFFALLFVVLLGDTIQFRTFVLGRALALVGIILVSVIVHEMGHAMVAARAGFAVRGVLLTPIGGLNLVDPQQHADDTPPPATTFKIAMAGPITSLLVATLSAAVVLLVKPDVGFWTKPLLSTQALSRSLVWTNVFLFALNLLPGLPMDGGRVLRAYLAPTLGFQQATRRAVMVGHALAFVFVLIGAAMTPWLMLLGFLIFVAAQRDERMATFQSMTESMLVEEIMLTHFTTLSSADTLEDALHRAVHTLQDDFPVVRSGDLVGVINRQTIVENLKREGNGYVQGAMNKAFEIVSRTESLTSVLRKFTARGLTLIPVVDQERLIGIVTLQNLMHSVGLLAESRRLRREQEEM